MKSATFERLGLVFALSCLLLFVFVPLVLIHFCQSENVGTATRQSGEVTVGIAVILRATARRWLRAGSRNLMRTTFGAYSRASARALTRRIVKSVGRILAGLLMKDTWEKADLEEDAEEAAPTSRSLLALFLGFVGLCLSFWGVLMLQTSADAAKVTGGGEISFLMASVLAGGPMLVYALILVAAGRCWGITIRLQTAIDGLLLQGYFTGAGSFLPMTTDVEYEGPDERKFWVAGAALGSMYVIHMVLYLAALWSESYTLLFASAMFLTYCFVYSFPIRPLEGYHLWSRSKLLWFGFWIPILLSFIRSLPESCAAIL